MSLLRLQEVNIEAYDNTLQMSESSIELRNQEYFTLTFAKPPQPGRKKRSRLSKVQITVPRYDKRKSEEVHTPAQIWIRHFLIKKLQRPSNYFTVRRQALFNHPYTSKVRPEKPESQKSEDSKENTGPHEKTPESKETANDKKPRGGNKGPESSHEIELSKKVKNKSETNPESKDSKAVLMKDRRKPKRHFKIFEKTNIESICAQKDSKSSENNSDAKSGACSKNSENIDLMISLEEPDAKSTEFDVWLKNCSQNNSKKPSKKEASKSSDTDSVESKDGKKSKKDKKKNKKKDAKKDTESTDESEASKNEKKVSKKAKKDLKKSDKKKESKKDTDSTDAESESESDARKSKKGSKNKKGLKKDAKKKDAKTDTMSTDADPPSERISKEGEKDAKMARRMSMKFSKKKSVVKSEESSETESDLDTKRAKRGSKKSAKKRDSMKKIESTDTESDESSKKSSKKPGVIKSSETESDDSVYKYGAKKKGMEESDTTSTDSRKGVLELKRDVKASFRKTTFKGEEARCRVLPSRSPPLPATPCEPIILSPRVKHQCHCRRHLPPPRPRYAPLMKNSSYSTSGA